MVGRYSYIHWSVISPLDSQFERKSIYALGCSYKLAQTNVYRLCCSIFTVQGHQCEPITNPNANHMDNFFYRRTNNKIDTFRIGSNLYLPRNTDWLILNTW